MEMGRGWSRRRVLVPCNFVPALRFEKYLGASGASLSYPLLLISLRFSRSPFPSSHFPFLNCFPVPRAPRHAAAMRRATLPCLARAPFFPPFLFSFFFLFSFPPFPFSRSPSFTLFLFFFFLFSPFCRSVFHVRPGYVHRRRAFRGNTCVQLLIFVFFRNAEPSRPAPFRRASGAYARKYLRSASDARDAPAAGFARADCIGRERVAGTARRHLIMERHDLTCSTECSIYWVWQK